MSIQEEAASIEATMVQRIRERVNAARRTLGIRPRDYTGTPVGSPTTITTKDTP